SSRRVRRDHVSRSRNEHYRTQGVVQNVQLLYYTDANVEFAKFQNGELDITRGVPSPDVPTVLGDPKLIKQVVRGPTLLNWWVDFNVTKAPLDNKDLRLAPSKPIDPDSYIKNVRKGIG